jgi:putative membrane protein
MNQKSIAGAAVLCSAALAGALAAAPTSIDRRFMSDAAADGMAEVELGKLAAEKASSDAVKDFAKRMVEDHSRANAELKALAAAEKVDLPAAPAPPHKALEARLRRLSGAEFDAAYMDAMVKDHEKAVKMFTRESTGGGDPGVKEWAGRKLPALRQHLEMARDLAAGRKSAHRH